MNDNCIQFKNDTNWDCTRDELNYTPFNEEGFNPQDFQEYVNKEFKDIHVNDNQLGIQQMFVPRYTNMYHMKDNTFGNILVYHSLGSGKTCTSIIIGETYRAAFQKGEVFPKIIVSTPLSIKENFINELLQEESEIFSCRDQIKSSFGGIQEINIDKISEAWEKKKKKT